MYVLERERERVCVCKRERGERVCVCVQVPVLMLKTKKVTQLSILLPVMATPLLSRLSSHSEPVFSS